MTVTVGGRTFLCRFGLFFVIVALSRDLGGWIPGDMDPGGHGSRVFARDDSHLDSQG